MLAPGVSCQGRFPHNVGYLANADPASVAAWKLQENNTIGTWLTAAGYHTAYLGKYVNGMETNVPSGWNHWGGFSSGVGTYNYFNATQWNVTFDATGQQIVGPVSEVIHTGVHQANFVGQQAANQMKAAAKVGRPFFVSVTATMVHYGTCYGPCPGGGASCYAYADPHWENDLTAFGCTNPGVNSGCKMPISPCPSVKHEHDFNNLTNPHVPSWNESESGDESSWMLSKTPLTSYEERRENIGFRNRTAACVDLDDMIGRW